MKHANVDARIRRLEDRLWRARKEVEAVSRALEALTAALEPPRAAQ